MAKAAIGIVGYGVVGRSLHKLFGDDAVTYDLGDPPEKRREIHACQVAFVCVPTPIGEAGTCDTSIVAECVGWIEAPLIVIRSTVAPGTTDGLRQATGKRVVFQPEYIGETATHPFADATRLDFIILGGPSQDVSAVADVYKNYLHSEVRFYFTTATTAEVAKYMENAFFATKVTFCNEFYSIAQAFGVDYNDLREVWLADPRISRDHTFVYPRQRGFDGKCLPKDIRAIIAAAAERGCDAALLKAVMDLNERHQRDNAESPPHRRESRPS